MPSIHYPAGGTLKKPENILWLSDRLNIRQSVWKPFLHVIPQNWERLADFKSEHTCCSKITCFSIPHIIYGNLGKRCLADVQVNFLWAWSKTKLNLFSNLLSKIKWQFIPADCFVGRQGLYPVLYDHWLQGHTPTKTPVHIPPFLCLLLRPCRALPKKGKWASSATDGVLTGTEAQLHHSSHH